MVKLLIGVFAAIFLVLALLALGISTALIGGGAPSPQAQQDIPPQLLPVYQTAADSCPGLPWSVLAAIGKVETDHARSTAPGVRSGANFAGAAGPMQIGVGGKAGNTWGGYAVDGDGGGADVYNPVDAIFTAANYLCQNGANKGADVAGAVFQFAYSELGKPYKWGATGELGFYDCSGLMLRAYQKGGVTLPRTSREQWKHGARVWNVADMLPGDLVFYAYNTADPATIHHVGIYIGAGNMIDAPYTGANVRITPFLRGDFIGAVRPTAAQAPADAATATTAPAG
jgi:hypothetical protein